MRAYQSFACSVGACWSW